MPVILAMWIGLIGLSVVVHRQWMHHEHLPYPIAGFVSSLLPDTGQFLSGVFRNRLFWIGFALVFGIHMNNYAATWWEKYTVQVPLSFDFTGIGGLSQTLTRGGLWGLFSPKIYFTAVAFAFFLTTEVSFSVGIAPYCYCFVNGLLIGYGISVGGGGGTFSPNIQNFLVFGAYLGMLATIVYTGRHFYASIFRRALLPGGAEADDAAVWGGRVFLVGLLSFVSLVTAVGLDWQLAALYGLGTVLIFLVMARILAETGLFFIQVYWFPCAAIAGLMGARALGPEAMLILFLLSMVLLVDPREALMPFMVNSLALFDRRNVRVGRAATWCTVALIVGLAIALPLTIYWQYAKGLQQHDSWATRVVPQAPFLEAMKVTQKLTAQGSLEAAREVHGWARFAHLAPRRELVVSAALAFVAVLVLTYGHLRFPKWPLHPVLLLIWATYPARLMGFSFLLGCALKALVTKYGGVKTYQQLKPLMYGLIAGELVAAFLPTLIGFIYFLNYDVAPKAFRTLPG